MSNLKTSRAERLDKYVARMNPTVSRAFAEKIVEDGYVTVNGVAETKGGYKLRETDVIVINYEVPVAAVYPHIEIPIIYEDHDCVVINKPAGILSHSKGAYNPEATVASWLVDRTSEMSGERAGVIHRLDRATSGVMICAKNPAASVWLQKQFAQRKVKKTYMAVVNGELSDSHAMIDMPIERNPKKPQTFRVGSNGKTAQTEYIVIARNKTHSLLELKPTTGRTHQLRVHLAHIGHPIVGDTLYDGETAVRLYLHAKSLEITVPSRERKLFETETPKEFFAIMK